MKKKDPNQNQVRQEEKEDRKHDPSKISKEAKNDEIDKHMEENGEHPNDYKNEHPLGSLVYSKDEIVNLLNIFYVYILLKDFFLQMFQYFRKIQNNFFTIHYAIGSF